MAGRCLLWIGAVLLAWIIAGETGVQIARAQGPSEYQVKAAFLLNFAKFVDWPDNSQGGSVDTIRLCIVGDDPFGRILDETVKGKTVNGRDLAVERIKRAEDARGCKIVFIGASEARRLSPILESLQGASVLTVGETAGFAERGGIVNFVLEDNRIHFEINIEAAERARLKISSKLLSLAKIVKGEAQRPKE